LPEIANAAEAVPITALTRPVQIDPTSPGSERPSSSLTTFDPRSLEIR
jgi:hypothetical protein